MALVGEVDECIKKAGEDFKTKGVLGDLISLVDMEAAYSQITKAGFGIYNMKIYDKLTLPLDLAKMLARHEVDSGPDDTILMEAIKSYVLWNELKDGNEKGVMLGLDKDFLTEDSWLFGKIKRDEDVSLIKLLEDELDV